MAETFHVWKNKSVQMQQLFCCSGIHPLIRYRILSIKLAGQKLQNEVLHFRLKLEKTISQTKYFPRAMST